MNDHGMKGIIMKMHVKKSLLRLAAAFVVLSVFGLGCERTETDRGLMVSPSNARIVRDEAITFVAMLPESADGNREIMYPLEWSVSDPSMGTLRSAAGDAVVYVAARRSGPNSVMVRDQSGAKGVAAITQASATAE